MYLGFSSSPDPVQNLPGGLYASGLEVLVSSCHKSPVENKDRNKCRQNALTSRDMSRHKATGFLYPYALLVLQAWHSQNHSLGLRPSALGPSLQEECWWSGTVLGSGRSGHLFLGTLHTRNVKTHPHTKETHHVAILTDMWTTLTLPHALTLTLPHQGPADKSPCWQ